MKSKLTPKQKLFCKYYNVSLNATDAALKAGYSKNTAAKIGSENLNKLEISTYLSKLARKTAQKIEISHDELTRRLKLWIESDVSELLTMTAEEIQGLPLEIRQLITGFKPTKYGYHVQFVSKEKAIDMVARHIGYYEKDNDQKKITIQYNNLSDASLNELAEASQPEE